MKAQEIAAKIVSKEFKPLCFNAAFGYDNTDMILTSDTYKSFIEKLSTHPVLEGTEKQISWAMEIREKYITKSAFDLTVSLINMWEETLRAGISELQEPFKTNYNKRGQEAIKNSKATNAAYIIENLR